MLYFLIKCISLKPATKLLHINKDASLRFWNFLMIGLRNSSHKFWFGLTWLFVPFRQAALVSVLDFYQKMCKLLRQVLLDFYILEIILKINVFAESL